MQLLVGQRASITRFTFPDNRRLVPARPGQMSIETIFRDVEFSPDEPLRERRLPFEDLFPSCAPDELARFSSPESCRLPHRFPVHPPVLTEAFDSRPPAEVSRWLENAFLDQMRFDIVVHEQSLICRRRFQGKRGFRRRLKS